MNLTKSDYLKSIVAIVILAYLVSCMRSPEDFHFISGVNLVIHEAGHTLCIFFGQFLYILGGSLTQVVLPLIFAGYFFLKRDIYSGGIILMWVGESVVEVSRYAADAVAMQLPLLGGDSSIHDWNWLLSSAGLLAHTSIIATLIYVVGVSVLIGGISASMYSVAFLRRS